MNVYFMIFAIVAVLVGAIILRNRIERQRCRALEREAQQLGFSFTNIAKPFEGCGIRDLAFCLQEGSSIQVENLVQGTICDCRMVVLTFVRIALWVKARQLQLTPHSNAGQDDYLFSGLARKAS